MLDILVSKEEFIRLLNRQKPCRHRDITQTIRHQQHALIQNRAIRQTNIAVPEAYVTEKDCIIKTYACILISLLFFRKLSDIWLGPQPPRSAWRCGRGKGQDADSMRDHCQFEADSGGGRRTDSFHRHHRGPGKTAPILPFFSCFYSALLFPEHNDELHQCN